MSLKSIIMALFCGSSVLAAIPPVEERVPVQQVKSQELRETEEETIAKIRKGYEQGKYSSYLKEKEKLYQKADLSEWVRLREQKHASFEDQEKWEQKLLILQGEKEKALLACLTSEDSSLWAQRIRLISEISLTPEEKKAFAFLSNLISKTPKEAQNEDEKALIELDLEYEYKALENRSESPDSEEQIALRMEKMDRMVAASQSFRDQTMKQDVLLASKAMDKRLVKNLSMRALNQLVKSAPMSPTEEKIVDTLLLYQDKFSSLVREIDRSFQG